MDLKLIVMINEPCLIEETILCDLKHASAPVYLYVKATFEVSTKERLKKLTCIDKLFTHHANVRTEETAQYNKRMLLT